MSVLEVCINYDNRATENVLQTSFKIHIIFFFMVLICLSFCWFQQRSDTWGSYQCST